MLIAGTIAQVGLVRWLLCTAVITLVVILFLSGCGSRPPSPGSRWDIAWTSRDKTHLVLDHLPIKDFPALKKFRKLREVQFCYRTATDEKLEALAAVGLTTLHCASLNGSSHVTDRGVEALARIDSVHNLGLEGTSITDTGLKVIASQMRPDAVNVASCRNISINGLLELVQTETLKDISFSANGLSTAHVIHVLSSSRNLDRFQVTGPSHHLDRMAIERAAAAKARTQAKGIRVVFQPKGSMSMDLPLPDR
jgi:hypothetical protein